MEEGQCVKELANVFLKPPQSICSFPSFPDDLFHSVQLEGGMWMGPDGGWGKCEFCGHMSWPLPSQWPQLTEEDAGKFSPAVYLE